MSADNGDYQALPGLVLDLFAGPGGWSEGLRMIGLSDLGIELDGAACATRAAAGHRTIRADETQVPTAPLVGKVSGLIASPPCPDWSVAGKRAGRDGESGKLVEEVPRWVDALRPEWVACEQVPPALPVWEEFAHLFRSWGYSAWSGILNAADYGVPQTRERAILIASRVGPATPPAPTHAERPQASLFGDTALPWVSMADALGWPEDVLVEYQRGEGMIERHGPRPGRKGSEPCFTLRAGAYGESFNFRVTWPWQSPATTVAGDPRITARCHHDEGSQGRNAKTTAQVRAGDYEGTEPIKLTIREALLIQSFRVDYPVQGNKTKQSEQVGNAVPPLLAAHIIGALVDAGGGLVQLLGVGVAAEAPGDLGEPEPERVQELGAGAVGFDRDGEGVFHPEHYPQPASSVKGAA